MNDPYTTLTDDVSACFRDVALELDGIDLLTEEEQKFEANEYKDWLKNLYLNP